MSLVHFEYSSDTTNSPLRGSAIKIARRISDQGRVGSCSVRAIERMEEAGKFGPEGIGLRWLRTSDWQSRARLLSALGVAPEFGSGGGWWRPCGPPAQG